MNYMEHVAHMLGVEVGEEFKVKDEDGSISKHKFKFTNESFVIMDDSFNSGSILFLNCLLNSLLIGKSEVIKIPFNPKRGEKYWAFNSLAICKCWMGSTDDLINWESGNCFRTKEEAETMGKATIEAIRKAYEEE